MTLTSPLHYISTFFQESTAAKTAGMTTSEIESPTGQDDEMQLEKNAGLIMGTNNSSIVSKRSVEKLYLPEPHFYRYFVRKLQRRSPTINRGYWLRMRAVDWVVRQFLETPSQHRKVVINLGCGYDPLPFQWMAREPDLCKTTKWVDIDYEELMNSKRNIIAVTPRMQDMLSPKADANPNFERSILVDSIEYSAIGCDLRNLPRLDRLIKSVIDIDQCLVLCVAEVSITYMHKEASDALIAWTATLSSDVTFCLLEQGSPDRPDHPFTKTMMEHFKKLGTPLHSVFDYPGCHTQGQRFSDAGYTHCECQNLWELWADPRFLSPSQRLALDRVEPFDEWEEFALFASHYNLVVAHNRTVPTIAERPRSRRDSAASVSSNISARTVSPYRPAAQWFTFVYCEDSGDATKRHHASAFQTPDQDAIAIHGGIGPKGRLSSTTACRPKHVDYDTPIAPPAEVNARSCHTVTVLSNGQNILIGGRGSPNQAMADCWIQTGSTWTRVHDLPQPRYRHRTVPVTLPDNSYGAVVYGGKTDASRVAVDTLLWHPEDGWSVLRVLNRDPTPRFGASFVYLGFNHGLLFGGMRQDGIVCGRRQGLWRWRLVIRDNKVAGISFRPSNALDASVGSYPWFARLGASHGLARDELLVIGGIAKAGCIPKPYEMLSMLGSFSAFNEQEREMQLRLTSVDPPTPPGVPRPFLVGHSTHRTKTGMLVFMGGGATCFSFGNCFNSGVWVLHERGSGIPAWTLVPTKPSTSTVNKTIANSVASPTCSTDNIANVPRMILTTPESFLTLLHASQPVILSSLSYGACSHLWTPAYLRSKLEPSRSTIIHDSSTRTMNFQRKDFTYKTLPFSTFLDTLTSRTSHIYLRSLSATSANQPANFFTDYPELARDFHFPPQMHDLLTSTIHSSPLRISNDIAMFLHYDVMSNILFQIHGIKKLVLFPPSDISRLSFPPGSTTSILDVFLEHGDDPAVLEGTSPQIVVLKPGEALHIPALWAHAGISLKHDTVTNITTPSSVNQHTNIALNIFFRSLPAQTYAAGRDVYGNRDLAAYEDGRRDLDKIVRRFLTKAKGKDKKKQERKDGNGGNQDCDDEDTGATTLPIDSVFDGIPKDMAKAYLERLADELKERAARL